MKGKPRSDSSARATCYLRLEETPFTHNVIDDNTMFRDDASEV